MDRPSTLKRSASQRDRTVRRQERSEIMANAFNNYSPLQNFVKAKKKINQIFEGIASFLGESKGFLDGSYIGDESEGKLNGFQNEVSSSHAQITSITEVLSRDHMKVVFFGRTSNGKSTVINAMLHDRILPSGIGHTTNCFLSVNGTDGQEAYLLKPDSEERQNVKSLSQLVHALCAEKLDCSSYVEVYWPKSKCALLGDDVELVDSPGIDVSPDLDKWIDDYCLDADVFVLVANAESTLMQTEKKFFHKVNERLSRPNIFILNNRWDASASEPEMMEAVKNQHTERAVAFLADELRCVNRVMAEDRVFFVSAKETLSSRMQKLQGMPEGGAAIHAEGFHARLMEFETFEHKFEECISKSAIKTKFEAHAVRALKIATDIKNMMEELASIAQQQREKCTEAKRVHEDRLAYIKEQQDFCSCECKKNIKDLKVKVQQQIADAMADEIDRLSVLVNEFEYPFHTHHGFLQMYKRELRAHIEKGLGRNLTARCATQLQSQIRQEQKDMGQRLQALLPPESPQSSLVPAVEPNQDFTVNYQLDVHNLCSDFVEDIEFHFSLGWSNLVRKYLAPHNARLALALGANLNKNFSGPQLKYIEESRDREVAVKETQSRSSAQESNSYEDDEIALAVVKAVSSLTSQTAYGFVIVAGLIWRAVGWKIIMFGGGLYGTLYIFERLRWNNRAKEMAFKRQFVEYSTEKLQLIISLTSSNCAHQVQQELSTTFSRLCSLVDRAKENLQEQILNLDSEITRLESIEDKAKILRNKAVWLEKELSDFVKDFGLSRSKI